ncbi:hypothetical protein [Peribacillus frigoritolerans]|uniref:hypothetical protein n=1 Tax=Peribacillus frigoritolerans TaxID=450367 RepID=UPI001E5FF245|nr:hypothetical protein [Peribacillus frigoritolerans]
MSMLEGVLYRFIPLQALAFRGRSALGAFAPVGSPLDSYSRRSLAPSVSINLF